MVIADRLLPSTNWLRKQLVEAMTRGYAKACPDLPHLPIIAVVRCEFFFSLRVGYQSLPLFSSRKTRICRDSSVPMTFRRSKSSVHCISVVWLSATALLYSLARHCKLNDLF
jgi:hypothetical protein